MLPSLGDEAIGGISPLIYSAAIETPVNESFVKEYREKFGKVPATTARPATRPARWINEAVKASAGTSRTASGSSAALRKVEIPDAPRGPIKLDAHGNPIQHIYMRKVEKKDGELWNTVIHTLPSRLPVLEVQAGRVPEAARVRSQLPAVPSLLGSRSRREEPTRRGGGIGAHARAVSKAFGGLRAVDGVSLEVQPGERRAIIGPNGAGKTTLFSLISGEQSVTEGRITLFGRDVTRLPPHRRAALGLGADVPDHEPVPAADRRARTACWRPRRSGR